MTPNIARAGMRINGRLEGTRGRKLTRTSAKNAVCTSADPELLVALITLIF